MERRDHVRDVDDYHADYVLLDTLVRTQLVYLPEAALAYQTWKGAETSLQHHDNEVDH